MITNEAEIRIALQAVIASVLALYGFWGCALIVFIILLPWKPLLAAGGYLVQPIVDWRSQKARDRHEKGIAQIEEQLDAFLQAPRGTPSAAAPVRAARPTPPPKVSPSPSLTRRPLESFKSNSGGKAYLSKYVPEPHRIFPPHWRFRRPSRIMCATYHKVSSATWT